MDRCIPGASIRGIRNEIVKSLSELEPDDLVVLEGGGNSLEEIGEQKTVQLMESMVKLVKVKVKQCPIVMCIPMRRRKESSLYGNLRRKVNRKCVEKLGEWSCDGLQLWERMDWRRVWGYDGIHFASAGKVWVAWNIVEWAQHRAKGQGQGQGQA